MAFSAIARLSNPTRISPPPPPAVAEPPRPPPLLSISFVSTSSTIVVSAAAVSPRPPAARLRTLSLTTTENVLTGPNCSKCRLISSTSPNAPPAGPPSSAAAPSAHSTIKFVLRLSSRNDCAVRW